jgi:ribosome maturation factor RimP
MQITELTERISGLLEMLFATDERLADCFTVDVSLHPKNKLCVFVDSDSGINFDKCKWISRYLEGHLDSNGWLGEKYVLEVSSPGVGRPLRLWRQYRNNIGRYVQVTLNDRTTQRGRLKVVEEHQIILEQEVTEKQGSKRLKTNIERAIPFEQITSTVVKVII